MKIDPLALPKPREPYRGISPFRLLDWRIFFEREAETQRLTNLVSLYRGVLLYGRSGAGKSSLLNAGLIPHALRQGRAPERIRVYPESGKELFVEPIALQESDAAEHSENELPRYLQSRFITSTDATEGVRLSCEEFSKTLHDLSDLGAPLLIFDQFEELVTLFEENPKDKEHFEEAHAARVEIEQLLYKLLVSDSLPLKLVFAFRDDYLARLTPLFSRIPNLMDQAVRLALPGIELLHHIVRGPFLPSEERGLPGGHFRNKLGELDELSEKLADKIESGIRTGHPSGVLNLSEVQTLCLALWQQSKRRGELLRADNPTAVLQEIIESTTVDALKKLLPWDRLRARALLANVVTQEGTRDVVSEENLISETRRNPLMWVFPRGWRKLLKELSEKNGLLRRSLSSGTTYYELASEFLISWIQKRQRAFRRLALMVSGSISIGLFAIVIGLVFVAFRLQNEKANVIKQKRIAQEETLRARKQNFEDMSTIEEMANRLVELSTPQEALSWHQRRASALSLRGMHEEAIKEYDSVLQLDPANVQAKFARGYEYYTQGMAEQALRDTESYLANASHSWNAHENRGLCLSSLGQYAEAEKAIRDSIREFQFTGNVQMESEVAPDIQAATGRTILSGDEKLWQTANYYELANLKAYAGKKEFDAVLTEADKQRNAADAALIALDWAWLHMEKRKEDYGALVAQGALWERAGFKEWAKEYYQRFERIHKQTKDKRYKGLARWASRRLARLKFVGSRPVEEASVDMLVLETNELVAKGELKEALTRIDKAIDKDPDNAMLHLIRASIFYTQKEYHACSLDCSLVLLKQPNTSLAYFWRGVARLKLDDDPKKVEADLRNALEHDPDNGEIMEYLSDALFDRARKEGFATSGRQLDEALQLLGRSTSSEVYFRKLPDIYRKIARVYCARGNFEEAIKSLDTAVAIIAKSSKALDFCWRALETLTANEKQIHDAEVQQEIAAMMATISQIIEHAGSRAKATEFWQSIADLESMKLLRDDAKAELDRLAKAR